MKLNEKVYFTICRMKAGRLGLTRQGVIKEFRQRFGDNYMDKNIRKSIKELVQQEKLNMMGLYRFKVANTQNIVRNQDEIKENVKGEKSGDEKKKKAAIVTAKQRSAAAAKKMDKGQAGKQKVKERKKKEENSKIMEKGKGKKRDDKANSKKKDKKDIKKGGNKRGSSKRDKRVSNSSPRFSRQKKDQK